MKEGGKPRGHDADLAGEVSGSLVAATVVVRVAEAFVPLATTEVGSRVQVQTHDAVCFDLGPCLDGREGGT